MAQLTINSVEFVYVAGPTQGYIYLPHYICDGDLYAINLNVTAPRMEIPGNRYPVNSFIVHLHMYPSTVFLGSYGFDTTDFDKNLSIRIYVSDLDSSDQATLFTNLSKSTASIQVSGTVINTVNDTYAYESDSLSVTAINNVKTYRRDINGNLYETVGGIARVYQDGEWKYTIINETN